MLALDHILIGAPTLESGIEWLEARTGVRAARGGSHPGLGTWNAVASLGPRQYIEILAPDPEQSATATFYIPGLRDFKEPKITTWAVRADGLASRFLTTLPPGFSCEPLRNGSRVRPDGSRLAWTLAFPKDLKRGTFDGALPFFIEWESLDNHPGRSAPSGLTLRSFSIRHPEADQLRAALDALQIECEVTPSKTLSFDVEVDSPRGIVSL